MDVEALDRTVAYWNAANYLTVGQIYLQDNALLREPLRPEHIKPRLLGHWGTSPGLNLVYVHLNRAVGERDLDAVYLAGPGHGGPAMVANVWLEGTYSEVYPEVSADAAGMRRLFRQFSTPGGIPSHVSVPTPGSIHEGGELGYVLTHAFGAAFDNPGLVVVAVVGDGEAETGPLEGSWKGVRFLDPVHDGAVLPILHLNGWKIANATVLARSDEADVDALLRGHGYAPRFVGGADVRQVHADFAGVLDECLDDIARIQGDARAEGFSGPPRWPVIVLRTPKGWTGPSSVDGVPIEGTFRAHQVPLAGVRDNPEHLALLERWMRSYRPEELFDDSGRLVDELAALAPRGDRRLGANPHANGGRLLRPLDLPDYGDYAATVASPGRERIESTRRLGQMLRDVFTRSAERRDFRLFCPDETASNRLDDVFSVENRRLVTPATELDDHVAPEGRVMEVLSEHNCEGWLEGYLLSGRHGLYVTYEAFAMVSASMTVQHTKWLEEARRLPWRMPVASLNVLLTSTCWRNDHNGFSHQGPGMIDTIITKRGTVARVYLPPDANCLLSVADHCLRSRDYVNLIVIDKQPQLQWLDLDAARVHCAAGASAWGWAGTETIRGVDPDIVLACAGDTPTLETVAAAWLLRHRLPGLRVRVVNVVDLMTLFSPDRHPHGMDHDRFRLLFTDATDVVFAFHGYPGAVHQIIHGRPNTGRFHVRGFNEQGTTTTPFDMVVLNGMSRYHLVLEALQRLPSTLQGADDLARHCHEMLDRHATYICEHFEDLPEIPRLGVVGLTDPLVVLCVNSGSSSLKWAMYRSGHDRLAPLASGAVEGIGTDGARRWLRLAGEQQGDATPGREAQERPPRTGPRHGRPAPTDAPPSAEGIRAPDHRHAVSAMVAATVAAGLPEPEAIGHRIVHGGPDHVEPALVDRRLVEDLRAAVPLAPLHLPAELAALEQVATHWPARPTVACFDTAFHAGLPEAARTFALPEPLRASGLRRYGFHGLSYEYVVDHLGADTLGRAVVAHLGNGASLCAIVEGRSVDTTMGFTPAGGLVMGSRPGDLDPGVLVHALRTAALDADGLEHMVNAECGLLGLSGTTGDMRLLLDRSAGDAAAALAVEVFCRTAAKHAGGLATVLDGLDSLVFTGGIGERAAPVRAAIGHRLRHLGVSIDAARNGRNEPVISPDSSAVTVRVLATDEDVVVARHTLDLVAVA